MYAGFENDSSSGQVGQRQQPTKQKKNFFSKEIQSAIFEVQSKFLQLSIKPYLSAYEALFSIPTKGYLTQLPLKIVFMQNYPQQRPFVYVTKLVSHQLVDQFTGEVKYESLIKWHNKTKIMDVVNKIQEALANGVSEDKFSSYLDAYRKKMESYSKDMAMLAQRPIPPNPPENYVAAMNIPQPPALDFAYVLRQKEFQEQLQNNCQNNNIIYQTLLTNYRESESKAQYISERFGKGRILKEMEAAADSSEPDTTIVGIENQLNDFYTKRKNYHRTEILKQKYLES